MTISFSASFLASLAARKAGGVSQDDPQNLQRLSSQRQVEPNVDEAVMLPIIHNLLANMRGLAVDKSGPQEGLSTSQAAEAALNETANAQDSIKKSTLEALVRPDSTFHSKEQVLQEEIGFLLAEIVRIASEAELKQGRSPT
jgi:flagellin-like hook-associated protein FlgL